MTGYDVFDSGVVQIPGWFVGEWELWEKEQLQENYTIEYQMDTFGLQAWCEHDDFKHVLEEDVVDLLNAWWEHNVPDPSDEDILRSFASSRARWGMGLT